jgi:hypothetical protein
MGKAMLAHIRASQQDSTAALRRDHSVTILTPPS